MKRFCVQSVITSSRSRVTAGDSQHSRHMRQEHVSTQHIAVMTLKAQNGHRRYHHSSLCRSYTCILTTAQPSYLHNLISLQPPRSTRSNSSLELTSRFIPSASPFLSRFTSLSTYPEPALGEGEQGPRSGPRACGGRA